MLSYYCEETKESLSDLKCIRCKELEDSTIEELIVIYKNLYNDTKQKSLKAWSTSKGISTSSLSLFRKIMELERKDDSLEENLR